MKSLIHVGRMNRFEDGENVEFYSIEDKWVTTCAPQDHEQREIYKDELTEALPNDPRI